MTTIQITEEQAVLLVDILRESLRTTYLDSLATIEDCDRVAVLTAAVVQQL